MENNGKDIVNSTEDYINPNLFGVSLIDNREIEAVERVLRSKELFRFKDSELDSESQLLEREIANYFSSSEAVVTSSGTAGLRAALHAVGVKQGSNVLISAYTFIATASAVISLGAQPEPVEIHPIFGMDTEDLSSRIKKTTAAIVPVHLPGRAYNLKPILDIAKSHNVPVIEDACQAFGAHHNGTHAGMFGTLGVYSFQQGKQISSGEGGCIVGTSFEHLEHSKRYIDHGAVRLSNNQPTWDSPEANFGENLRMSELHAAILRIQFAKVDNILLRQRQVCQKLSSQLNRENITFFQGIDSGSCGSNILFLPHSSEDADTAIRLAAEQKLLLRRIWSCTYYQHSIFGRIDLDPRKNGGRSCPLAESVASRLLCLPIPPILEESHIELIFSIVCKLRNYLK